MSNKLTMNLPHGFISAVNRRHNGANHTKEEINSMWNRMQEEYKIYCKNRKKRDFEKG